MRPAPFAFALVLAGFASVGCSKLTEPAREEPIQGQATTTGGDTPPPSPAPAPAPAPPPPPAPAPDADMKLDIKDVVVGKGPEAKKGDTVRVHYRGTLLNGTEFDASRNHPPPPGQPEGFSFPVGGGRVIKGWDEGIPGMKVGGKRKLTIPSSMGYGARGAGEKIPPNSTLVFDVELLEIKK